MSDEAVRRTLRRCTALLLVPLSLRVVQFREFHASNGVSWRLMPEAVTFWLPALLVVGALGYLVASLIGGLGAGSPSQGDASEG